MGAVETVETVGIGIDCADDVGTFETGRTAGRVPADEEFSPNGTIPFNSGNGLFRSATSVGCSGTGAIALGSSFGAAAVVCDGRSLAAGSAASIGAGTSVPCDGSRFVGRLSVGIGTDAVRFDFGKSDPDGAVAKRLAVGALGADVAV